MNRPPLGLLIRTKSSRKNMSESTKSASSRCKVSTSDSQSSVQADLSSMETESPTFSTVQVAPSFSYDIPRALLTGHSDAVNTSGVRWCPEPNGHGKLTLSNCLIAESDQASRTRALLYGDQGSPADRVLPTLSAIMKNNANADSGAARSQAVSTICKLLASAVSGEAGDRQHAEPRAAPGASRSNAAGQSAPRYSNSTPAPSSCATQVDAAFQSAASNLDAIFRAVQTSLAKDNAVQHPSVLPIVIAFGINSDKLLSQATTSECGNQTKTLGNANVNVNASPLPRSVDANDNNNNNSANQHQRRALSAACNSLFQRTAPHTVGDDLRASRIELPPMAADVKPLNAAASNMLPSMNACDGGGGGSGSSAARPRSEQSSVADGGSAKQRNKITQKEHYETTFEPCQVCGDKASGRHYGVVSCEGCKGFFKRSIRRSMNYECRGTRSCMVNKAFRNRCQHCRLRKCLETGMKSEAVQHERKPLISTTQYTDMNKSQSSMSSAFSVSPSSTAFGSTDTINSVLQSSAEKALPTGIGNLTEKMQSQSTATPIESTSASLADLHQDECLASESDKQRDAARYDPDGDGDDACVQRASKRMRFCTEPAPCLSNSHIEPASSVSSENDKWPRPETTQSHCSSPTCTPAAVRSGRAASAPIHGVSTYESAPDSNATIDDQAAVRKLIKDIYACNLRWFESVPILPEREARRTFSSDESLFDSFLLTCFQLLDEFKLKQLCQKLFIAMRTIQTDSLAQNGDEQPNSAGLHEQLELAEFFQVVAYLASEFAQAHFEENEVTYLKLLAICNPGTNAMGVCDSVQGVARAGAQLTQFVQLFTHISTQFHLYLEQKRCQAKDSEAERLSTLQKLNATFKILLMLSRLPHKGHVQKLLVTLINSDKDESLVD